MTPLDDARLGSFAVQRITTDAAAEPRVYRAATAQQAAERAARDDYAGDPSWEACYRIQDGTTGDIWTVTVGVVHEPSFIATSASRAVMPDATHVLWGGRVLCEDLRLREVPRDWPERQRWVSLTHVAEGVVAPNPCQKCWTAASGLVKGLLEIGKKG